MMKEVSVERLDLTYPVGGRMRPIDYDVQHLHDGPGPNPDRDHYHDRLPCPDPAAAGEPLLSTVGQDAW